MAVPVADSLPLVRVSFHPSTAVPGVDTVPAAPGFPAARRNRIPGQVSWACSSSVSPVLGGKPVRRLIAADRTASVRVTAARGSQGDHEHPAAGLGAHEPVRWRLGRVEQRVAGPHIIDVIDSEVRMLEQARFRRSCLAQGCSSTDSPLLDRMRGRGRYGSPQGTCHGQGRRL